jgi:thioesterase domain-containing protein
MGATIALEMANQLRARGEEVGLLASFDSAPTKTDYYDVRWEWSLAARWAWALPYRLMRFVLASGQDKAVVLRRKWHKLSRASSDQSCSLPDRARGFAHSLTKDLFGDPTLVPAHHQRVVAALYRISCEYAPQQYAGSLTLFRAAQQPWDCSHDPLMGWARLACGGVSVQTVAGEHETILKEPNARELAHALTVALAASRAGVCHRQQDSNINTGHGGEPARLRPRKPVSLLGTLFLGWALSLDLCRLAGLCFCELSEFFNQ